MITVYHNPKCRKSRAGLQCVADKGIEHQVVEYLKTPFTTAAFKDVLMKLNKRPVDLVRMQEDIYREKFKGKNFTDEEWINILLENPKLIQRPIVVKDYKAMVGHDLEELEKFLEK